MKKLLKIFCAIIVICLIAILTIKLCFTFNKGAVSPVAIEDIKSVQIINLDRSTNRREGYEKRLKNAYGDEFLGQKIGDAIRLSGTDGVKDLVIIELDDKGNEVKNVDIAKLNIQLAGGDIVNFDTINNTNSFYATYNLHTNIEGFYKDEGFDKYLKFRTKSISNYYSSLNKYKKDIRRVIPRLLAWPFIWIIKAKKK